MKTSLLPPSLRRPALALAALTAAGLAAFMPLSGKDTPKLKLDEAPLTFDSKPAFTFGPIIKRVSPSVVNIYTAKNMRDNPRLSPMFNDPLFRQFFGGGNWENVPRERRQQSLGSGVIVSTDGYILTNNHVLENADEIKVALADNVTTYSAKLVGADPQTDIAVIKVDAKDLPAIIVADSDRIEVGDFVLALGNPFGVGQTVTMGIVSAKGRGGMGIVDYEDFIQTDASINPGNSGGALVDSAGRLVGINTAILSGSGGNQGVGFAVPINLARYVMERLVADGKITRGQLGVMIQPITPELAKEFKLPENTGALVGGVTPQSPAEEAGIKAGDVIIELNGKKVTDGRQLRLIVGQTAPGTSIAVKALRDGKEQTFNVKLTESKPEGLAKGARSGGLRRGSDAGALDGVSIEDIDPRARRQFEIPPQIRGGALIVGVAPGSTAAEVGLKPGDVIIEINRQPIESADDAIAKSRDVQGDRVLLRVWSGGGSRYVLLEANPSR
jgi:serine protease Do